MADISDIEQTLVTIIGNILIPNGVPATSYSTKIYRGFPSATTLDGDLANQISHVIVNEAAGYSRPTIGYLTCNVTTPGMTTLTVSVSGTVVTFGGTANATQLAGVMVNGVPFSYECLANDTPTTVAAALVALINAAIPSYNQLTDLNPIASGPTITFNQSVLSEEAILTDYSGNPLIIYEQQSGFRLIARVGSTGTNRYMPRYQTSGFRIMTYAYNTAARDAICSLIDQQISANYRFITLADGQSARMIWRNQYSDDMPQKEQSWRRDLLYTVEYSTSIITNIPPMLFGITEITPQTATAVNAITTPVEVIS